MLYHTELWHGAICHVAGAAQWIGSGRFRIYVHLGSTKVKLYGFKKTPDRMASHLRIVDKRDVEGSQPRRRFGEFTQASVE